jgi:FtsP/CotA-like multicopper oxidase with cupredoxin domain
MDGVAGVTQDAVPIGGEFSYRFVADQVGTYWYHSHQVSNDQLAGGLFGPLAVLPRGVAAPASAARDEH